MSSYWQEHSGNMSYATCFTSSLQAPACIHIDHNNTFSYCSRFLLVLSPIQGGYCIGLSKRFVRWFMSGSKTRLIITELIHDNYAPRHGQEIPSLVSKKLFLLQDRQLSTLAINIARWRCQMSSSNFQGCQQVFKLIVKGSHLLLSGLLGSYVYCHFRRHVSWAVVILVITQDLPRFQLGSLVVLVLIMSSCAALGLNHGDNESHRGRQCHHMGHQWRHAG